jgi:hypothetical protein
VYIGQTGRSIETRVNEQHRHIECTNRRSKSPRTTSLVDTPLTWVTGILVKKSRRITVREATEIDFHSNIINKEGGIFTSSSWKPHIRSLKETKRFLSNERSGTSS